LQKIAETERSFMQAMEGGCAIPLGIYSKVTGSTIHLIGYLGSVDGKKSVQKSCSGDFSESVSLGSKLAKEILKSV
jgi:hydroxymethylbilane synthase